VVQLHHPVHDLHTAAVIFMSFVVRVFAVFQMFAKYLIVVAVDDPANYREYTNSNLFTHT
jgi:hypothetical protein